MGAGNGVAVVDAAADEEEEEDAEEAELLVRQVIEENPVQEQGIREEWSQRVGWHRKEIVRPHKLRGGEAAALEPQIIDEQHGTTKKAANGSSSTSSKVWVIVLVLALICGGLWIMRNRIIFSKQRKHRSS
jgi:hypothetical protein